MDNLDVMLLFTTLGTIAGALSEIVEDEETKHVLVESRTACIVASLKAKAKVENEK